MASAHDNTTSKQTDGTLSPPNILLDTSNISVRRRTVSFGAPLTNVSETNMTTPTSPDFSTDFKSPTDSHGQKLNSSPGPPSFVTVGADLVEQMRESNGGGLATLVGVLQQLITRMDSQFASLFDEIQSVKTMQGQVVEVRELAHDALECAHANSQAIDEVNQEVTDLKIKLREAESQTYESKHKLEDVMQELTKQKKKTDYFENYLKRDNLLFINIKHSQNENCETRIRDVIKQMGVPEHENIKLVRCHRVTWGKAPHPILCRFQFHSDRQTVFEKRFALKGKNIFIEEHFTDEVYQKRKSLLPVHLAARRLKMKSHMKFDKVVIEGTTYDCESIDKVPDSLQTAVTCSKRDSNTVVFFGEKCPLSNFFKTSFFVDQVEYHSSEQYLQHQKALLFKDDAVASKIMSSKTASQCKTLSKKIKGVNETIWQSAAPAIMKKGLEAKFQNDELCKSTLLQTGSLSIGESASNDVFWGTGVALTDSLALNTGAWRGENHMGKILEDIRESLTF